MKYMDVLHKRLFAKKQADLREVSDEILMNDALITSTRYINDFKAIELTIDTFQESTETIAWFLVKLVDIYGQENVWTDEYTQEDIRGARVEFTIHYDLSEGELLAVKEQRQEEINKRTRRNTVTQ
jgi:hypothetical protein